MSHINEEWEKEFDEKFVVQHPGDEHPFVGSWDAERGGYDFFNAYKIKAFIRTLYLQALEQGRTEGSRGDYGRRMYMNGYKEALEQAITTAKNETFRLKAPHEIEREYYEKNTGWEQCQAAIVKELEALSNLRKV